MFRLFISLLSIFIAQALNIEDVIDMPTWKLKAAHHGISKHIDVSWEDVHQIQQHYKTHRPMQVRNTEKVWSLDHTFRFMLKNGHHFEYASIKAQPKGFHLEGKLNGVKYNLRCEYRCHVKQSGMLTDTYDSNDEDSHKDTLLRRERQKIMRLYAGKLIDPPLPELNCLTVILSEDCEYHHLKDLDNNVFCEEAMNAAVPEARENGINVPLINTASTLEGKTSPDCSTDGRNIIFNERGENMYVRNDGFVTTSLGREIKWTKVSPHEAGAELAHWDTPCSKVKPCICQFNENNHSSSNYTGGQLLCKDVDPKFKLKHPHVNMLGDEDEGDCHPTESIVRVQHPCDAGTCVSPRRMDELQVGDLAESTPGVFEPIIAFSRRDSDSSANYYEFIADNRTTLHISKGHYLYVNKKLTLPKDVRLGDIVSTGETITDIHSVKKQGIFHPHTWSTKLVVNGVQTSTNTASLELSIQDYISTPIAYILYKLDVPIDINHRFVSLGLKRGRQLSSWFDGLRSCLSHTFVAPFLEILFGVLMVPVFTCCVFPETLAVAAMGYYVYKERTKKI